MAERPLRILQVSTTDIHYRSLYQLLRSLPQGARRHLLEEVRVWARVELTGRPTHRTLSPDEVIRLGLGDGSMNEWI